ncbi:hypothetical protein D3C85_558960 [compost metagenome]
MHHTAVGHRQGADETVDGCAHGQLVDPALGIVAHQALAFQFVDPGLERQAHVFAFQARRLRGVLAADIGRIQGILGLLVIDLGDDAHLRHAFIAFERALRGQAVDLGRVGFAPRQQFLLLGQDLLARHFRLQLLHARLFALERVGQVRRLQHGQDVALFHRVARLRFQRDGGHRGRIQGRADGGDDAARDGRVADQGAARDVGDAQAAAVDGMLAVAPTGNGSDGGADDDDGASEQQGALLVALARRGGQYGVLGRGIADHGHVS